MGRFLLIETLSTLSITFFLMLLWFTNSFPQTLMPVKSYEKGRRRCMYHQGRRQYRDMSQDFRHYQASTQRMDLEDFFRLTRYTTTAPIRWVSLGCVECPYVCSHLLILYDQAPATLLSHFWLIP